MAQKSQRYAHFSKRLGRFRSEIDKCKKCKGEGWYPSKQKDGVVTKYTKCNCKLIYERKKLFALANFPIRRYDILNQKFKKAKAIFKLNKTKSSAKEIADKYIERFDKTKGVGLILFGDPGTGKTTTALYILASLIDRVDGYYVYFKDLMTLLISTYGSQDKRKRKLFDEIIDVDLLIIDELSLISKITAHSIAEFTSICKQRFEDNKPTIIVSNFITLEEIYQNFGPPMESLVKEAFLPFQFIGKDFREDGLDYLKQFFE